MKCKDLLQEETQIYEKKSSFSDKKKIMKTICAFANTYGGTIAIGVGKEINGVDEKEIDKIQKDISDLISTHFSPKPLIEIKVVKCNVKNKKKYVILIYVKQSENIVFYDGKVYVRIGSTNVLLTGNELIEFLKSRNILNFEDNFNEYSIEEISIDKVNWFLEKKNSNLRIRDQKDLEHFLLNSNLAMNIPKFKVRNLAFLLFAKDIRKIFPHSGVKVVFFKGIQPVEIIKHKIFFGTVFELIDNVFDYLKDNLLSYVTISNIKRKEKYKYPLEVIRELIVNAIGHRDYFDKNLVQISVFEDRIIFHNPGRSLIEIENLGTLTSHRNPNLYLYLSMIGYGEGYGTGIARIRKILKDNNYPMPIFRNINHSFQAIIYNKSKNNTTDFIYQIIEEKKEVTLNELSEVLNISKPAVLKHIKELILQNKIKKIGTGRSVKYVINL